MKNENLKCEICSVEVTEENAVFFCKDVSVNPDFSDFTNVYCGKCAKENNLI